MSYNISTFKLKELENFSFPVSALYEELRSDWYPDRINHDDGSVAFENMETTLKGTVDENEVLHLTSIDCSGEGSGTVMNDMLEPAFKKSSGILVAACIWEGGDSLSKIMVRDGEVQWEEIEL